MFCVEKGLKGLIWQILRLRCASLRMTGIESCCREADPLLGMTERKTRAPHEARCDVFAAGFVFVVDLV
jgi:hypothetical protein